MGRSTSAGDVSGESGRAGLLRRSSKCLVHLLSCCSVPVMIFPSLSLTGHTGLLYICLILFSWCRTVVSYFCCLLLLLPGCQCSCICLFLHSSLPLFLVCLCTSRAFAAFVRWLLTADLFDFRTWIVRQVSRVIQSSCCCFLKPSPSWQIDVSVRLVFCHWLFRSGSTSCRSCNTCRSCIPLLSFGLSGSRHCTFVCLLLSPSNFPSA